VLAETSVPVGVLPKTAASALTADTERATGAAIARDSNKFLAILFMMFKDCYVRT
jgi:hypothetical protein